MFVLIAIVVVALVLFAVWRVVGPDQRPVGGITKPVRRKTALPPDDNPDFLRDLDRRPRPDDIR